MNILGLSITTADAAPGWKSSAIAYVRLIALAGASYWFLTSADTSRLPAAIVPIITAIAVGQLLSALHGIVGQDATIEGVQTASRAVVTAAGTPKDTTTTAADIHDDAIARAEVRAADNK